jgi:hypothetical protein
MREQGNTTKEGIFAQQGEKDQLCDSKADLNEERQDPSRIQFDPHG